MTTISEVENTTLKRTPLYDAHIKAGARMVPFGGWEMPVQYAGLKAEHQAVRNEAGVFDVSHMGQFRFSGPDALNFLQHVTPNDVSKLRVGRAHYNWLPNEQGGLVDDVYIYRSGENEYLMVTNASNIDKDWEHLNKHVGDFDVQLKNESDDWGLLAVQGPKAIEILQKHTETDLNEQKKNAFFEAKLFGLDVYFARTGYTGEDGFEVFIAADQAETLWDKVLETGIVPAGLGARDTLRLEAGFPLYGHEFSETLHALSSNYNWVVKDKPFLGRAAIDEAPTHILVGLKLDKVPVREGYAVYVGDKQVGHITSGTSSPTLGHPIALALVETAHAETAEFTVDVRGKQRPAQKTAVPFYKRA